jgi:hypothetical protein
MLSAFLESYKVPFPFSYCGVQFKLHKMAEVNASLTCTFSESGEQEALSFTAFAVGGYVFSVLSLQICTLFQLPLLLALRGHCGES